MMKTLKKPIIYSFVLIALGSLLVTYSRLAQADVAIVDFLIVAGGASGGGNGSNTSGGGGGGGEVAVGSTTVTVTSYSITVGTGGAAVATGNGNSGGNSSAFGTTTLGGGAGAQSGNGVSGGTGGGGGGGTGSSATTTGGSATGSYFGYNGGYGQRSTSAGGRAGGGGGGAGGVGENTNGADAGDGGIGYASSISGSSVYYGGGGGGSSSGVQGTGGTGGGGTAGTATSSRNGTNGLGGGGAGLGRTHTGNSGSGGNGVVVIAYETGTMTATGGATSTSGGNTIHTFTSNGTFVVNSVGVPPTPDPMVFHAFPAAVSTSSIAMTATTSVDASPPIEYFFRYAACGTHAGTGGTNSSWQSGTSYTDSGLQINQCYGYTVAARDDLGNTTASSSFSDAYTLAAVPGPLTLADQTTTSMKVTNNANGNPSHTTYVVQVLNSSPNDPGWEDLYLEGDGTSSTTAVWLTDSQIDALTITGLTINTYYEVRVKARNGDGIETAYSAVDSLTTNDGSTISPPSNRVQSWIRGGTSVRGGVAF